MLLFQFIRLLLRAIDIYMILISAYVVCTWFPQARNMTLARWLQAVCEPFLSYFEKDLVGLKILPLAANESSPYNLV